MKKLLYLFGAMALMAGFTACGDNGNGPVDFDDVVDPGFYVVGEAVGVPFDLEAGTLPTAEARMANGYNENSLKLDDNGAPTEERGASRLRSGMYEKYVWLEAGKDFELVYFDGDEGFLRYGSALDKDVTNSSNDGDFPTELTWAKWGDLTIGEEAPMLQVEESGFYHIILDDKSNVEDKADFALIMVNKVKMGLRGAHNGAGCTYGEEVRAEDGTITWTWTEQTFTMAGQWFKFAYNHGWKIALDLAGNIKANTNLGWTSSDDHSLLQGGPDILVDKKGIYTITLTYKMAGGDFKNSFTYNLKQTGTVETNVPENLYINGGLFGGTNWDWTLPTIVEMTPVKEKGAFYAVRHMPAGTQFKFCAVKSWEDKENPAFSQLGGINDEGFVQVDGNAAVEAEGLYLILVDYDAEKIVVKPAKIYGMGPCFNVAVDGDNWLTGKAAFTVNGQTASIKVDNAGTARMYVELLDDGKEWWRSEWGVTDGKIVYRGNGADPVTPVTADQTITLDFNAGTATIK